MPSFTALLQSLADDAVIAVDMPIGLPDFTARGGRGPETLVRPLLGERQSSVFSIPSRAAVYEILARTAKRGGDELQLETDAQSLSHPMAMVQLRHLLHPGRDRRA
jgi:predicted RNase H-like nuclease